MSDKRSPRVRFNDFSDDWNEVSFSDLYKKTIQKNDLTYGNSDIISVANMYYSPNELVTNAEYLKTYNVFRLGDIAFEGNKSKEYAYGRFVENTIGDGIVSHVFKVFRPIMEYDLDYWKYAINEERVMRPHLAASTKSSTMMKELRDQDFLKEKIAIPSVDEQQHIGTMLKTIDQLIEYYEWVIPIFDKLIKSRFIEIIRNDYPRIELGLLMKQMTDVESFKNPEEETFVTLSNKGNGARKRNIGNGKTPVKFSGYRIRKGQFIYSRIDARNGSYAIVPDDLDGAVVSKDFPVFNINEDLVMPRFLIVSLLQESFLEQVQASSFGSTNRQRIKEDVFSKYTIILPPLHIQKQFSLLAEQIDKSKLAHTIKLQKLKDFKQSMIEALLIM